MSILSIDEASKILTILMPETDVTIQTLYNEIRVIESTVRSMSEDQIMFVGGKDDLGGGESTGITITLVNDWRLSFEARPGPIYESRTISRGNLVAINSFANNPISPTAFTQVQIRQSQAPSILEASTADVATAVWEDSKALTLGKYMGLR